MLKMFIIGAGLIGLLFLAVILYIALCDDMCVDEREDD